MKFDKQYKLAEVAKWIDARAIGDPDFLVSGINEIHMVEHGDLTFVDHPKYYEKALNSAATTIIINKEVECPEGKTLLYCDDPFTLIVHHPFNHLESEFGGMKPYFSSPHSRGPAVRAITRAAPRAQDNMTLIVVIRRSKCVQVTHPLASMTDLYSTAFPPCHAGNAFCGFTILQTL